MCLDSRGVHVMCGRAECALPDIARVLPHAEGLTDPLADVRGVAAIPSIRLLGVLCCRVRQDRRHEREKGKPDESR